MENKIRFSMMLLLFGVLCPWLSTGVQAADRVVVIPMAGARALKNIVTVAKANGKFTDPVTAISSITDASATNPYLILIGPGEYTLTTAMVMKPYVDVSGSGENVTLLTGEISGSTYLAASTLVTGSQHSTLSNLTVTNTGGNSETIGIYYPSGCNNTARLHQVDITVTGGTTSNYGVYNQFSSPTMTEVSIAVASMVSGTTNYGVYNGMAFPRMTNLDVSASGGSISYGVYNSQSAPDMTEVNVTAQAWGGDKSYGIYNVDSYSPITMTRINVTAKGGVNSYGIYNYNSSAPTMSQVNATASGGTNGFGIVNRNSSPVMTEVNATASGTTNSHGVYNFAASVVKIRRSTLTGASSGLYLEASDVTISQSTIINGVLGTGQKTCIACDNGAGVALAVTCGTP